MCTFNKVANGRIPDNEKVDRWFGDYMVTVMLSCVYIITGKEPCTGRSIFR